MKETKKGTLLNSIYVSLYPSKKISHKIVSEWNALLKSTNHSSYSSIERKLGTNLNVYNATHKAIYMSPKPFKKNANVMFDNTYSPIGRNKSGGMTNLELPTKSDMKATGKKLTKRHVDVIEKGLMMHINKCCANKSKPFKGSTRIGELTDAEHLKLQLNMDNLLPNPKELEFMFAMLRNIDLKKLSPVTSVLDMPIFTKSLTYIISSTELSGGAKKKKPATEEEEDAEDESEDGDQDVDAVVPDNRRQTAVVKRKKRRPAVMGVEQSAFTTILNMISLVTNVSVPMLNLATSLPGFIMFMLLTAFMLQGVVSPYLKFDRLQSIIYTNTNELIPSTTIGNFSFTQEYMDVSFANNKFHFTTYTYSCDTTPLGTAFKRILTDKRYLMKHVLPYIRFTNAEILSNIRNGDVDEISKRLIIFEKLYETLKNDDQLLSNIADQSCVPNKFLKYFSYFFKKTNNVLDIHKDVLSALVGTLDEYNGEEQTILQYNKAFMMKYRDQLVDLVFEYNTEVENDSSNHNSLNTHASKSLETKLKKTKSEIVDYLALPDGSGNMQRIQEIETCLLKYSPAPTASRKPNPAGALGRKQYNDVEEDNAPVPTSVRTSIKCLKDNVFTAEDMKYSSNYLKFNKFASSMGLLYMHDKIDKKVDYTTANSYIYTGVEAFHMKSNDILVQAMGDAGLSETDKFIIPMSPIFWMADRCRIHVVDHVAAWIVGKADTEIPDGGYIESMKLAKGAFDAADEIRRDRIQKFIVRVIKNLKDKVRNKALFLSHNSYDTDIVIRMVKDLQLKYNPMQQAFDAYKKTHIETFMEIKLTEFLIHVLEMVNGERKAKDINYAEIALIIPYYVAPAHKIDRLMGGKASNKTGAKKNPINTLKSKSLKSSARKL